MLQPSTLGFNRKISWQMDDLHAVLSMQGVPITKAIIHKIIKKAGYTFRKARRVLTQYRSGIPGEATKDHGDSR